MFCISFSSREVLTQRLLPFSQRFEAGAPFSNRSLLSRSTQEFSSFLRKQDGHPFYRPGEPIKLVAAVQCSHTLLLFSSIRLCRGAAAMFSLVWFIPRCTCKSVRLRGERDNDRLWSAKYHLLCDLWVASGEFTIFFCTLLMLPVNILSFSPEMVDVKAPSTVNLISHFL